MLSLSKRMLIRLALLQTKLPHDLDYARRDNSEIQQYDKQFLDFDQREFARHTSKFLPHSRTKKGPSQIPNY